MNKRERERVIQRLHVFFDVYRRRWCTKDLARGRVLADSTQIEGTQWVDEGVGEVREVREGGGGTPLVPVPVPASVRSRF